MHSPKLWQQVKSKTFYGFCGILIIGKSISTVFQPFMVFFFVIYYNESAFSTCSWLKLCIIKILIIFDAAIAHTEYSQKSPLAILLFPFEKNMMNTNTYCLHTRIHSLAQQAVIISHQQRTKRPWSYDKETSPWLELNDEAPAPRVSSDFATTKNCVYNEQSWNVQTNNKTRQYSWYFNGMLAMVRYAKPKI